LNIPVYTMYICTWYILGINLEYSSIYYVYTLSILSMYSVYATYILRKYIVIIAIKYVYTWFIPCDIYYIYSWYITVISPPDWYMHGIYMVYTWYIPVTCSPHTYGQYIHSKNI
jgi:hypothetical protein